MLKSIFSVFEVTESQITAAALKRLKWAAIGSLPAVPLVALVKFGAFSGGISVLITGIAVIATLCLLYTCSSRLLNRLWIPERYLDEAEIARKRKSASLAFQYTISAVMILALIGVFWLKISGALPAILPTDVAWLVAAGCIVAMPISLQTLFALKDIRPIESGSPINVSAMDKYYKYGAVGIFLILAVVSYALR